MLTASFCMDMKQLRERAGLETVDVASKLRKSESTIRNWDTGRQVPTVSVLELPGMLATYQCTLEELIDAVRESRAKYEEANREG